ncbi:MAG TPA: hypothetical protein VK866_01585 [Acidimicrobiales bacterium]|nr:hypothetical protein [Acidimicrobiales bacterium]
MTTRRVVVAIVVIATTALAVSGVALAARGGGRPAPPAPVALTLSGAVDGLFPGASTVLPVNVGNPYRFAVRVTSLEVVVGDASAACRATVLELGPAPPGAVLPRRGSAVIDVPIAMRADAPNECQGAVFPVDYTATAERDR